MDKSLIPYLVSALQIQALVYVVFFLGFRKNLTIHHKLKFISVLPPYFSSRYQI